MSKTQTWEVSTARELRNLNCDTEMLRAQAIFIAASLKLPPWNEFFSPDTPRCGDSVVLFNHYRNKGGPNLKAWLDHYLWTHALDAVSLQRRSMEAYELEKQHLSVAEKIRAEIPQASKYMREDLRYKVQCNYTIAKIMKERRIKFSDDASLQFDVMYLLMKELKYL
jgi:hypothetical protein